MAELVLFHHAHGLTPGVVAFADRIRMAGHVVHTPDLFDGQVFETVDEGVGFARTIGFETLIERGAAAAEPFGPSVFHAGMSLGVLPAQMLAQTRTGARGAILLHAVVPVSEFSEAWPAGVPVQIHAMDNDPFFVGDGDIEAARELVSVVCDAELFLYPGDRHLFTDASIADYDEAATDLVIDRILGLMHVAKR